MKRILAVLIIGLSVGGFSVTTQAALSDTITKGSGTLTCSGSGTTLSCLEKGNTGYPYEFGGSASTSGGFPSASYTITAVLFQSRTTTAQKPYPDVCVRGYNAATSTTAIFCWGITYDGRYGNLILTAIGGLKTDTDGDLLIDTNDTDDDNDGVLDTYDLYPLDNSQAGDYDGDGVEGLIDNCADIINSDQLNTDGDAQGNACDTDDDNDGVLDGADKFPLNIAASVDVDTDGFADRWNATCNVTCQLNSGLTLDNCPGTSNANQLNTDGDAQGNVCDADDDNDGVFDANISGMHIDVGNEHACVLDVTGVHCWGYNGNGQTNVPVLINPKAVSAGGYNTCAIDDNGVQCWGSNSSGQNTVPVLINPQSVSVGVGHICAIDDTGVHCWGSNANGQTNVPALTNPRRVSAGDSHACAIDDNGLQCWGNNGSGQSTVPSLVNPVVVSAGTSHTCAIDNTGLHCWGDGGEFGATIVPALVNPVAVSTGYYQTCTIDDSGARCWGYSASSSSISHPVEISAGFRFACAVGDIGVSCWGNTSYGKTVVPNPPPLDEFPLDPTESVDTDKDGIGNNADTDDDNDGMPDAWETTYGFNPLVNDANGDADNDGISNLQEYLNGSNPKTATTKNDYNNDGIAGWIWKGVSNGSETASQNWQLTFPLYSANWAVPNRFYHPVFPDQVNWEIMTSGDFNKDGDADILWRNLSTAQWKVWQIQNGQRVAQNDLADFDLDHAWQVIGAGDTDKDGDDDIILNSSSTGYVMIWEMQGHAIINTHNIGAKPGYVLNRIGDFNKDGDVDLLFREIGSDVLATWEIEANVFVQERALANTGANYNPVCAGDFDNDGDDDIMLVNNSTTQEKWFVMENYVRSQVVGSTNSGFVLKGCGDYDGDGDADSLWQRLSDDANRVILQQNYGASKQTVYTNIFGTANGFVYRGNSN